MFNPVKYIPHIASLALCFVLFPAVASAGGGLDPWAKFELSVAGVDKYLGKYTPVKTEDIGDGWVKHSFDSADGEGPVCIDGSDYAVFTRKGRDRKKLLIMLQGGGACWQGLYACSESIASQQPPAPRQGIWDFDRKDNPFARYSIVYVPYCDGSAFVGDNRVIDPSFDAETGVDGVRHHRGLRNLSAGMDVARDTFKKPKMLTVAGSSAGGVGSVAFAPFLARFVYGNKIKRFTVFNDAGPIALSQDPQAAIAARVEDWQFDQFYPSSCTECSPYADNTVILNWRLKNDRGVRDAFYETDADTTNMFFAGANLPGTPPFIPLTQNMYRDIVLDGHDPIVAAYPDRYKRFIVSGDRSHTALQTDLFYSQTANGVPLNEWTKAFLGNKKSWVDIVEDFVAAPPLTQ